MLCKEMRWKRRWAEDCSDSNRPTPSCPSFHSKGSPTPNSPSWGFSVPGRTPTPTSFTSWEALQPPSGVVDSGSKLYGAACSPSFPLPGDPPPPGLPPAPAGPLGVGPEAFAASEAGGLAGAGAGAGAAGPVPCPVPEPGAAVPLATPLGCLCDAPLARPERAGCWLPGTSSPGWASRLLGRRRGRKVTLEQCIRPRLAVVVWPLVCGLFNPLF